MLLFPAGRDSPATRHPRQARRPGPADLRPVLALDSLLSDSSADIVEHPIFFFRFPCSTIQFAAPRFVAL